MKFERNAPKPKPMKRRTLAIITAIILSLTAMGWECTAAPKVQCQDGSTKVEVKNGHRTVYHCHNGEWIKGK